MRVNEQLPNTILSCSHSELDTTPNTCISPSSKNPKGREIPTVMQHTKWREIKLFRATGTRQDLR